MDSPNQKFVVLDMLQRANDKILPWEKAVKKLKNKKDNHLLEWSQLIQDFTAKYQDLHENEVPHNSQESVDSEFELEEEQRNLLANNSCFMVRSNLEEGKPRVSELLFTEKFIKEVEHSVDSFVSLILQDGIPQFTPKNDSIHTLIQKTVLKNYFTLENSSSKVPQEHFSQLLTKDSHIKDVKTQVYLFPKKFNGKPAIDVIYVILEASISDQQLFVKGRRTTENKIYKEKLQRRETEMSHFLMSYYQDFMPKPIVNLDKVCGIRELPPPSDDNDDDEETDDCYIESLKSESLL